jgi:tryptophanyl-tRNA synthetase
MTTTPRPVSLTGIKPTGVPHLGNYIGAIRPAIELTDRYDAFYFIADYHALTTVRDPALLDEWSRSVAASWVACGLDPERVTLYRQSDIPETFELTWALSCVTAKGLLNRAHAYKAAMDRNSAAGAEPDAGVSVGLFLYPLLMAADILLFRATSVPVGRDQVQHIEIARDLAARFNHRYGEHLVLPEAAIDESAAALPGLDGRKMSKSYGNSIPLFASASELKKLVFSVVTDSRAPGEPKDSAGSALFALYQAFATPQETEAMRAAFAGGIAWGEAKQLVFERIEAALAPMRSLYQSIIAEPARIEARLADGAAKARALAAPFLGELRRAAGLRSLS